MCQRSSGYKIICPKCRVRFYVCQSCYRGHRYCCQDCSKAARLDTFRRASASYQQDPEVRKGNAAKQKAYRARKKSSSESASDKLQSSCQAPCVTQHTSIGTSKQLSPSAVVSLKRPKKSGLDISNSSERIFECFQCGKEISWFFNSS